MIEPRQEMAVADVAAHYNDLDRFYRDVWGEHVHHGLWTDGKERSTEAVEKLICLVADKAKVSAGDRVCDIGCGYGATSRYLVDHYGADLTGLTVSDAQYKYAVAQTNGEKSPRFLLQDWEENAFDASSFDAVVSIECLAHVRDKQKYFDEIYRVLRPGKRAAITAWLAAESPSRWKVRHLLEPICREGRLAAMGSPNEYRVMAEQAGLRVVESQQLCKQVRKTWGICTRRVAAKLLADSDYRRFLIRRPSENWIFLVTLGRIMLAYRTGAMDYGLFVLEKPSDIS